MLIAIHFVVFIILLITPGPHHVFLEDWVAAAERECDAQGRVC
jgi:hypothetical protein